MQSKRKSRWVIEVLYYDTQLEDNSIMSYIFEGDTEDEDEQDINSSGEKLTYEGILATEQEIDDMFKNNIVDKIMYEINFPSNYHTRKVLIPLLNLIAVSVYKEKRSRQGESNVVAQAQKIINSRQHPDTSD